MRVFIKLKRYIYIEIGYILLNARFPHGFINLRVLERLTCLTGLIMHSGIPVDSHGRFGSLGRGVGNG